MYVPLHVHSEFSLLDGFLKVTDYARFAREQGMPAVALTDHGNMFGFASFLQACEDEGVQAVAGCEFYVCHGDLRDKTPANKDLWHLVLLAKNQAGLVNLYRLNSLAWLDGFYHKPRLDRSVLAEHREGLVCLSACLAGEVAQRILNEDAKGAQWAAEWYQAMFHDDFYLELQHHQGKQFDQVVAWTTYIAQHCGIPLVGTHDSHYLRAEDAEAHRVLLAIGTQGKVGEAFAFEGGTYHVPTVAEMAEMFRDHPEALSNTLAVAAKCEPLKIKGTVAVPPVPGVPEGHEWDEVRRRAHDGLKQRYGDPLPNEYHERMVMELDIIWQAGFARYLLLVADVVAYAKEHDIFGGPRGSAAGSLVCHGLGISEIDPLRWGLIFERFINPERIEPPDVDYDVRDDMRADMIAHFKRAYGQDRVASITTFGSLGAKQVVRDVGRALGMEYMTVQQITGMIPAEPHMTIDRAVQGDPRLAELTADPALGDLFKYARLLEGHRRHAGTHAAGVVVAARPLVELAPLTSNKDNEPQVQWDMDAATKVGLLKMDVLGVDFLTVVGRCLQLIRERHGEVVDRWALPLEDAATFEMLSKGRCHGVFQLGGSDGMKRVVRQMRPTSLADLMALVALYRPGPLGEIQKYVAVKHGEAELQAPHPLLTEIVRETNGVIVYQEQILRICREVAGYTYGQADVLRKAVGKKKKELLLAQHDQFVQRAMEHSALPQGEAEAIWAFFEPFARYGFNRAHACCYAFLAYQTAYLKRHYTLEWFAALLESHRDDAKKIAGDVAEALAMGLELLPPEAGRSAVGFSIEDERLRVGLGAVKGVGEAAAQLVVDNAPYLTVDEVYRKLVDKVSRDVLEALVKAGVFAPLKRAQLLAALPGHLKALAKMRKKGQLMMFDEGAVLAAPPAVAEAPLSQLLAWERELLGVYVTDNPVRRAMQAVGGTAMAEASAGDQVTVVGQLQELRVLFTRKDRKPFAAGKLVDVSGGLAFVCFPRTYQGARDLFAEDTIVICQGQVNLRDGELQLVVEGVRPYEEAAPAAPPPLAYNLAVADTSPDAWLDAWQLARDQPGGIALRLCLMHGGSEGPCLETRVREAALADLAKYGELREVL